MSDERCPECGWPEPDGREETCRDEWHELPELPEMGFGREGRWLRKTDPRPKHVCKTPREAENRDVWICGPCERVYIWSDAAGYGFQWRRVWFRYWWFRAVGG